MQVEPSVEAPVASGSKAPAGSSGYQPGSLVHEGVASGLNISLHPLPVLSISDHYTRTRLQSGTPDVQVFGALLGTQTGRDVEIVNSFEFAVGSTTDSSQPLVDHGFFKTRQDQFKQVFPTLDFMGWYAIGKGPTSDMLELHNQLLAYSESPLLLLLSPSSTAPLPAPASTAPQRSASGPSPPQISSQDLPVAIFEPTTEIIAGEPHSLFIRCAYAVETGEAERVAVDGVAKPTGSLSGGGAHESPLVANLTTQRNAIDMLHQRVRLLVHYLDQVGQGAAPVDHEVLRQISALAASLPAAADLAPPPPDSEAVAPGEKTGRSGGFKEEYLKEYNDVLLTSYLTSSTKSLNATNDLFDRFLFLNADRPGGPAGRGMGPESRHERSVTGGSGGVGGSSRGLRMFR